jgi:hypothetical protein
VAARNHWTLSGGTHRIRISVDGCGDIEIHMMFDKVASDPPIYRKYFLYSWLTLLTRHMDTRQVLAGLKEADGHQVRFNIEGEDILVIDKDGFIYKGERLEDLGQAHRAFIMVMQCMWRATSSGGLTAHELLNIARVLNKDLFHDQPLTQE